MLTRIDPEFALKLQSFVQNNYRLAAAFSHLNLASITFLAFGLTACLNRAEFTEAGPADANHSGLTANPQSLRADGTSTSTLVLVLADVTGGPVMDLKVTVSSDGSANTLGETKGTTDANGHFTTTINSTRAEVKHVLASVGTHTYSAQVTFIAGPPATKYSTLTANPNSQPNLISPSRVGLPTPTGGAALRTIIQMMRAFC
jgi:hypothetical protein